jgi:hypothetical protein
MKRILRLSALTCAIVAVFSVVSLTLSPQSNAYAGHRIRITNGGYYNGYGQGYYGGYGQGYGGRYGQGYGNGYGSGNYGYSGYGNGPYGYGNGIYYGNNYGNSGYYGQSYGQGYYYSPYGFGVSTPLGYFGF